MCVLLSVSCVGQPVSGVVMDVVPLSSEYSTEVEGERSSGESPLEPLSTRPPLGKYGV